MCEFEFQSNIFFSVLIGNGLQARLLSAATVESPQVKSESDYHSIIKDTEKGTGK